MKQLLLISLLLLSCSKGAEKIASDEKEVIRQMQISLLVAQREKVSAELAEIKAITNLNSILSSLFKKHKLDSTRWQLNERLEFEEIKEKK